jgi:phytoene dehydrogenase-like protein
MKQASQQCVIIGGGIAGLAIGALMGRRGLNVRIVEANPWLGGKCRRMHFSCGSYVDTGPSIFTFPEVWRKFLATWLEGDTKLKASDNSWDLNLKPYKGLGIYNFKSSLIDLTDKDQPLSKHWHSYIKKHAAASQMLCELTYTDPKSIKAARTGLKLLAKHRFKGTYESYVEKLGLPSELSEIIAMHALNTGAPPSSLPAFFASLAAGVESQGVWYPEGGMYEIVNTLIAMNKACGNRFETDTKVLEISAKTGVRTDKATYKADIVINSLDYERFSRLTDQNRKYLDTPYTASAVAIYAKLKDFPSSADHIKDEHIVLMPDNSKEFFADVIAQKVNQAPMSFASVHSAGSKVYPKNSAPVMGLIVTLPPNGKRYPLDNSLITRELNRFGKVLGITNLPDLIEESLILDPKYYGEFGAQGGAIYGRCVPFRKAGPMHPVPYEDKHLDGVWHVGTSVHPGGGIPAILGGVMIAAAKINY